MQEILGRVFRIDTHVSEDSHDCTGNFFVLVVHDYLVHTSPRNISLIQKVVRYL